MNWTEAKAFMRANPGKEIIRSDDAEDRDSRESRIRWSHLEGFYKVLAYPSLPSYEWEISVDFEYVDTCPSFLENAAYEPLHTSPKPALTLEQAMHLDESDEERTHLLVAEVKRLQTELDESRELSAARYRAACRNASQVTSAKDHAFRWKALAKTLRADCKDVNGDVRAEMEDADRLRAEVKRLQGIESLSKLMAKASADAQAVYSANKQQHLDSLELAKLQRDELRDEVEALKDVYTATLSRLADEQLHLDTVEAQLATLRTAAERVSEEVGFMLEYKADPSPQSIQEWQLRLRRALDSIAQADKGGPIRNCCHGGGCSDRCHFHEGNLPAEAADCSQVYETFKLDNPHLYNKPSQPAAASYPDDLLEAVDALLADFHPAFMGDLPASLIARIETLRVARRGGVK